MAILWGPVGILEWGVTTSGVLEFPWLLVGSPCGLPGSGTLPAAQDSPTGTGCMGGPVRAPTHSWLLGFLPAAPLGESLEERA